MPPVKPVNARTAVTISPMTKGVSQLPAASARLSAERNCRQTARRQKRGRERGGQPHAQELNRGRGAPALREGDVLLRQGARASTTRAAGRG